MSGHVIALDTFTTFGDLLKYLRRRAQLTQQELAIAVGYSEAQISRLEHNYRPPESARLMALFLSALHLEHEPDIVARLSELAEQARSETAPTLAPPVWMEPTGRSKSNLPVPLTSFIGRQEELAAVCELLSQPRTRLLTLSGAGGCGKTRLALRAGEAIFQAYMDGVWLVDLAPLSDPNLLYQAVIQAMGLQVTTKCSIESILIDYLRDRRFLLLLDNCEHLIESASRLTEELLRACPYLQIIATSREPLRVPGEVIYRVPSLSLPLEHLGGDATLTEIQSYEAVQLLVERARDVQPDFHLSDTNTAAVVRICRQLDGLPLAIELAAACLNALSVDQVADRLNDRFGLLTGGSRTVLPRYQTMRASIEWSYNLLSGLERMLLQRLSVFAGGWSLEAAEQVCAGEGVEQAEILGRLSGLVSRSLVIWYRQDGAVPRYRMLETIRQYAHERLLESGEEERLRARHLDHFLCLTLQSEPHLRMKESIYWLDKLDRELDNVRLALEWALSHSIEKGLRLAASLMWFWHIRNHRREGADLLERLLRKQETQCDDRFLDQEGRIARGKALNAAGILAMNMREVVGSYKTLEALGRESKKIFQEQGEKYQLDYALALFLLATTEQDYLVCRNLFHKIRDLFHVAECDKGLFSSSLKENNIEKAYGYAEENLALRKEIGDRDGEGDALADLALLEFCRGELNRSIELVRKSQSCFETIGNQELAAACRVKMAFLAIMQGDYRQAIQQSECERSKGYDLGNNSLLIDGFTLQGLVAWAKKDYGLAISYCDEALELAGDFPFWFQRRAIYLLARVALSQGNYALARRNLARLLQGTDWRIAALGILGWLTVYHVIQTIGVYAVAQQQIQWATVLFGAQEALCSWIINTLSPPERSEYEQALATAREMLSEEAFTVAWETGQAMTAEQVRQFVMDFLRPLSSNT